jgi:hypothetical protein
MQINTRFDAANRRMNTKYLVVVAAMAVMLVATTALATDSAFADKKRRDTMTKRRVTRRAKQYHK